MDPSLKSIALDLEHFRRSAWRNFANTTDGYYSLYESFLKASLKAKETGELAESKILWLFGESCGMILRPESPNQPFGPLINLGGRRSFLPEDFEDSDLSFLHSIVEEIDLPWLQARVSEFIWLMSQPREIKYALLAIDSYQNISLDHATWYSGGRECWERAVSLSLMLRSAAGQRLSQIESNILRVFDCATAEEGFFALELSEIMRLNRLGSGRTIEIAQKLGAVATQFNKPEDLRFSSEYYRVASLWYKLVCDTTNMATMIVLEAESYAKEADHRINGQQPSYMAAGTFYEKAVQTYRSIPRNIRTALGVEERILELQRLLREAGQFSLEEMVQFESDPIDLGPFIEEVAQKITGKDTIEALLVLANIHRGADKQKIEALARKKAEKDILSLLGQTVHYSGDGRVVAKEKGLGGDAHYKDAALWAKMVEDYHQYIRFAVAGTIIPALQILMIEHPLYARDFISIAKRSPISPAGRYKLIGRGLFAGYDKDFALALHILVPQLEHLIRWCLNVRGVRSTVLDQNGIESEMGFSALLEIQEAEKVFGVNTCFELRALFCDAHGANLRNELAHGLLSDDDCETSVVVYAWWFIFRLVFNPFWKSLGRVKAS